MSRVLAWLKAQLLELLPVALFFFVLFNLRAITDTLIHDRSAFHSNSQPALAALALVAARVLLLTDRLPFMTVFSGRPLIFSTFWKALIYSLAGLLYQIAKVLIPLARNYKAPGLAWPHLLHEQNWSRFWGIQLWLFALLLLFAASRELIHAVGGAVVIRRLFFHSRAA